jgi:hypothetical protein
MTSHMLTNEELEMIVGGAPKAPAHALNGKRLYRVEGAYWVPAGSCTENGRCHLAAAGGKTREFDASAAKPIRVPPFGNGWKIGRLRFIDHP